MFGISNKKQSVKKIFVDFAKRPTQISPLEKIWSIVTFFLGSLALITVITINYIPVGKIISPIVAQFSQLKPLSEQSQNGYEVFGFAPYWTINKLDSVDFSTLTTFAYFGVPINPNGSLDKSDYGYTVFKSQRTTDIFKKAHKHGTKVVLTITNMDNDSIESFLSSSENQQRTIEQTVSEVKARGIDGVNIDVEYVGTPTPFIRDQFSMFVKNMTEKMHKELPDSRVTVSVYASAAKQMKLVDIAAVGNSADGVFMMAYDFAVKGSEAATPTAPLYGYKEGKYSYDIATAVEDFSNKMPADKIILGVPYYGYNYVISGQPRVKAATYPSWSWRGRPLTQTYDIAVSSIKADREGWDELGQVGWKAYYVPETGTWRMIFLDDAKSLGIKYDFAKEKNLAGVGMWALGFDSDNTELWSVLKEKFGARNLADSNINFNEIN